MAIKTVKTENLAWHYLTDFSNEELGFLKSNFKFHPLDLKDCAGEIQRSKIDIYKNYLFIILQLPTIEKDRKKVIISQVYFFVGKDYLITISQEKINSLNDFFYKAANNQKFKEEIFSKDSGRLLYRIIHSLLRISWGVHGDLENQIRKIETEIDEGRGKKSVFEIAFLRRIILHLKTIIDPQRMVTNALSKIDVDFLNNDILVYFDDLDDFVEKNWFILDGYKDRVRSLYEINESLISYQTNRVMKILMIFSVALLPLTLLSGVYGMNIELPFMGRPHVIWIFFGIMVLAISIIMFILKRKDWI